MPIRRKVLVKGIVQGVSYRKQAARIAAELNVKGWVRNRTDGRVEACLEGTASAVDSMLVWCFIGPERAVVEEVAIKFTRYRGRFSGFQIRTDRQVK